MVACPRTLQILLVAIVCNLASSAQTTGSSSQSQTPAGVEGGGSAERVNESEEGEGGVDRDLLREPAEGKAHQELKYGGGDGHGGLRASHEMTRHDEHERGLRNHAGEGAEEFGRSGV